MFFRLLQRLLAPADDGVDAGALAAVNAAIESKGEAAPPAPAGGDDGGSGEGDEAAAAAAAAAAGGEGAAADAGDDEPPNPDETAEEKAARAAAGDTRERDEHGRFKAKAKPDAAAAAAAAAAADPTGKGKKAPTPEIDPATGKPKVAAAAPKKADHVNDPIPDDVKGRTRERMEGLIAQTKDLTGKLEGQTQELTDARTLIDMIDATGATPDLFARHMHVLQLMGSTDVEDKRKVLTYLRKAADQVGAQLGETVAGKDPLEDHQDLIDKVEGGTLSKEDAAEIATHRNRTKAAERLTAEAGQRNDAEAQRVAAEAKTTKDLDALTAELKQRDGAAVYARKHALIVPVVRRMRRTLDPKDVVQAVREHYDAITLGPAVVDTRAKVGDQGNNGGAPAGTGAAQPLRPKQGAGGAPVREPKSALDAVNNALTELTA